MRKYICFTFLFLLLSMPAYGVSLWSSSGSLFSEMQERQVGDIITIVVSEKADAQHKSNDDFKKDVTLDMKPSSTTTTTATSSSSKTNILASLPIIGLLFNNEYKKDRQSERNSTLTATITSKITKVYPNGNLGIEGKKNVKINNELQELLISGVIRPQDIAKDNTVPSDKIADAAISYNGGISFSNDPKKRGILDKIFGKISDILF